MDIKDVIKINRIKAGLTMKELGEKVGVSEATVCRWESGAIASLKQSKIQALAKVLGITEAELITGVAEPIEQQYYLDDETAALAQSIKDDPDLRILMDASRKLSPEELKAVITMVKVMKGVE